MNIPDLFRKKHISKKQIYMALVFVFGAGLMAAVLRGMPQDEVSEKAAATPSSVAAVESSEQETYTAEAATEAAKEEFVPSIDELNLAHYYPKGADTEDRLNSYAGEIYKELMKKDNEYLARIFDTSGMSPRTLASKLGVSTSRVMGKYNPADGTQNPDDPSTWYIPDFKNVNVSFYNADGKRINECSNVKDIMSMASVYCYSHGSLDPEAFKQYCEGLYGKSRNYSISIGNVYYDDGCINRSAKEEADGIKRIESSLELLKKKLSEDGEFVDVSIDTQVLADSYNSPESEDASIETAVQDNSGGAEIPDGYEMVDSAFDTDVAAGTSETESLTGPGYHNQGVLPETEVYETVGPTVPDTAAASTEGQSLDSAEYQDGALWMIASDSTIVSNETVETTHEQSSAQVLKKSGEGYRSLADADVINTILGSFSKDDLMRMDDATLRGIIEEVYDYNDSKKSANGETDVKSKNYCPGHVDLYVKVTIAGFQDEKGLKSIKLTSDPFENSEVAWKGWTEDKIEAVTGLISRDWYKTYGFSISTIDPKNPLTEEEISKYLDELPKDISSKRKKVIKFALESVGKVPYYYGGKAGAKGYEKNSFGSVVSPDHRGRVLKGLDCSGWIQWVYWSAIGDDLNGSASTSSLVGEGEKIKRANLRPGDIIIREGADSHVVMFLAWAGNGNMIAIHENGSANNVSVNEVTASYPYYRKLIN